MRSLITGGTKGIGRATALALASPEARILINYAHDDDAASALVQELREREAWAEAIREDAGDRDGLFRLAEHARSSLGGLDLLVHGAVTAIAANALEADPDQFRLSVERNGLSLLWVAQAFKELLAPGSSIIYLTSMGSTHAVHGYAPIGVAKAVGEALVRYLAVEFAPRQVRVNAVSAGAVDTEAFRRVFDDPQRLLDWSARRNPAGRALTPEDVANAVVMVASSRASMVQGEVVHVDGGLRLRQM